MSGLASVADVTNRLDFDLDDAERVAVASAVDDLSEEARFYSGESRWEDAESAPPLVKTTIAKAVARWARNMNGYIISRAGDESLSWPEAEGEVGSPSFSAREIKLLKTIGSGRRTPGAFGTISVVAYAPRVDATTYIGMGEGAKPMPWLHSSGW